MLHTPVAMSAATMTTTGPRLVAHQRMIRSIMVLNQKAEGRSEKQKAESRKQKCFASLSSRSRQRYDWMATTTSLSGLSFLLSAFCLLLSLLPSAFNSLSSPFVDERDKD